MSVDFEEIEANLNTILELVEDNKSYVGRILDRLEESENGNNSANLLDDIRGNLGLTLEQFTEIKKICDSVYELSENNNEREKINNVLVEIERIANTFEYYIYEVLLRNSGAGLYDFIDLIRRLIPEVESVTRQLYDFNDQILQLKEENSRKILAEEYAEKQTNLDNIPAAELDEIILKHASEKGKRDNFSSDVPYNQSI